MHEICRYCQGVIIASPIKTKVGFFCSTHHYDAFLNELRTEDYIQLQNTFCVCQDEE